VSTDGNNNKEKPTTTSNIDAPISQNQSMQLAEKYDCKRVSMMSLANSLWSFNF